MPIKDWAVGPMGNSHSRNRKGQRCFHQRGGRYGRVQDGRGEFDIVFSIDPRATVQGSGAESCLCRGAG